MPLPITMTGGMPLCITMAAGMPLCRVITLETMTGGMPLCITMTGGMLLSRVITLEKNRLNRAIVVGEECHCVYNNTRWRTIEQ